jgi:lipopolysaccharide export system protein LptC
MIAITPAAARPVRKKNRNRHRKPVRVLRTILPAIAIGMAVAIVGQGAIRAMAVKPAAPAAVAPLRMDNPRFTGTLKDGRAFLITATSATRDLNNADQVFLKNPQLTRGYGSDKPTHVVSKDGAYQEEKGSLLLTGDVKIDNGAGLPVRLAEGADRHPHRRPGRRRGGRGRGPQQRLGPGRQLFGQRQGRPGAVQGPGAHAPHAATVIKSDPKARGDRPSVCFLYIAQTHQILHSLPIAIALARAGPTSTSTSPPPPRSTWTMCARCWRR